MELEKAYQTQNVGVSSSGTLTAILETKDARIATLEKEVGLLEQELDRMRLYAGSTGHALDRSVQFAAAPAFKHQVSSHRQTACDTSGHLRSRLFSTMLVPCTFPLNQVHHVYFNNDDDSNFFLPKKKDRSNSFWTKIIFPTYP